MQLKDSVRPNPPNLRYRRIWLLLAWGMVVSVVVSSLIPVEIDLSGGRDKIAHLLAYGSLSLGFGMLFGGRARQLVIAIAFAAMGVALEFLQGLTDYRTFEIAEDPAQERVRMGGALARCLDSQVLSAHGRKMARCHSEERSDEESAFVSSRSARKADTSRSLP